MKQMVTIASVVTEEEAQGIAEAIEETLNEIASFHKAGEEFKVTLNCDPEMEFFRVDSYLNTIKRLFPSVEVYSMAMLEFEAEFCECRLCGERYDSQYSGCPICHTPIHGDGTGD